MTILSNIVDRGYDIQHVVADRVFSSDEEAGEIIKGLSKAAVDLNLSRIVSELGQAEAMSQYPDILAGVPEATPVLRPKVCLILIFIIRALTPLAENRERRRHRGTGRRRRGDGNPFQLVEPTKTFGPSGPCPSCFTG